ncbi:MAG: hypothetical protein QF464_19230, partial [Myxococcota bacterium]|nr:hypothetical protein [Myxococcota bacterium]
MIRTVIMGAGVVLVVALASPGVRADGAPDLSQVTEASARGLLDTHPHAPGVAALAARHARRGGELVEAAWLADLALRLPGPHPLALAEGRALGWAVPDTAPAPSDRPLAPAWPWWTGALFLLGCASVVAWRRRDLVGGSALAVGLIAAVVAVPAPDVPRPMLPAPLVNVGDGAPCEAGPMTWREGQLRLAATCDGASRRLVVSPRGQHPRAVTRTARHAVSYLGAAGGPQVQAMVQHIATAVSTAEAQGFTVSPASTSRPGRSERWRGADPATRAQLRVAAGLVMATLWVLLAMLLPLLRS